eukprot:COSAG01_NODE_1668_length_9563_cov_23.675613_2_plen_122_part_00
MSVEPMSGVLRCRSLPGSIQALMEPAQALTTNTFALALELAHKSIVAAASGQSGGAALPKLAQQLCARRRRGGVLTEIYLCDVCSCPEILRRKPREGGHRGQGPGAHRHSHSPMDEYLPIY